MMPKLRQSLKVEMLLRIVVFIMRPVRRVSTSDWFIEALRELWDEIQSVAPHSSTHCFQYGFIASGHAYMDHGPFIDTVV